MLAVLMADCEVRFKRVAEKFGGITKKIYQGLVG